MRSQVALNLVELEKWGNALTEATPEIVEHLQNDETPASVAQNMEKRHRIPQEITLKYIVALGNYGK